MLVKTSRYLMEALTKIFRHGSSPIDRVAIDYSSDHMFMLKLVSKTVTDTADDYFAFLRSECAKETDTVLSWRYINSLHVFAGIFFSSYERNESLVSSS